MRTTGTAEDPTQFDIDRLQLDCLWEKEREREPVADCEIFVIFTPQSGVTPRHLHTFYIQHSDYVMRTWPVGGRHKNRHRHHRHLQSSEATREEFLPNLSKLQSGDTQARPGLTTSSRSRSFVSYLSFLSFLSFLSSLSFLCLLSLYRCRPTCRLISSICQAGHEGCIMNDPQWVEKSDNIYLRFVLEIGT